MRETKKRKEKGEKLTWKGRNEEKLLKNMKRNRTKNYWNTTTTTTTNAIMNSDLPETP